MALLSFVPGVFLINGGAIAGISVGAVALVAAIVVFFVFFFPKAKCKKNTKFCKEGYEEANRLLTTSCRTKVARLGVLGKNSSEYAALYDERKKSYDNILQRKDIPLSGDIKRLTKALENKEYHEIKESYGRISRSVEEYKKVVSTFNGELTSLLDDDTNVHSSAVITKEKYRRIKEFYETHKAELTNLRTSFDIILSNTDAAFKQFDTNADSGEFSKAQEIVSEQNKILDSVLAIMDQLPLLEASLNHVIPDKQKEMNDRYQALLAQDFILSHLNVAELNQRIDQEREELNEQLSVMDVRQVKDRADALLTAILDMESCFVEEENAKKTFLSSQSNIRDYCFNTEKRYSQLMNRLPEFQSTFVMNNKYVEQMNNLKSDIEAISYLKRDMDSYLDTANKQPYSVIIKTMNEIESEMKKTENMMNEYQAYVDSLKNDSAMVYEGLRQLYVELLKAQNTLINVDVIAYTKAMTPKFDAAYRQIAEIYQVVLTLPVNVSKAVELYTPFRQNCMDLIKAVKDGSAAADDAERCIVYGNAYNQYQEAKNGLIAAQTQFFNGDFAAASKIARNVVSTYDTSYVGK